MSDASPSNSPITPSRIRSKHRRRLISKLSSGDATVSKLANECRLRMPHVSAEIRRLRNEGLVSSDLPAGSRGARIRLTEKGWTSLENDEWTRLSKIKYIPSNKESCCIISRDEENLTLCFLSPPLEPMVQIPNRILPNSRGGKNSTRSQGVSWSWAVLSEITPRWFDRENRLILDSPPAIVQPGRIEAYSDQTPIVGIIRAQLLDSDNSSTISPGEWFLQPSQIQNAPLHEPTYHRGDWILGSPHNKSPDIRPTQPVVATIKERLPKSVLLRSARINSLVVADLGGLEMGGDGYPMQALEYWIEKAHPRLTSSERKRRLSSLMDKISKSKRVKVDDSTIRKFRKDWAGARFILDDSRIRQINLRGLGKSANESLVRWSLEKKNIPLVLEASSDLSGEILSSIAIKTNLRLVFLEEMTSHFSNFDTIEIDKIRTLPWLKFTTGQAHAIPVRLVEQGKNSPVSSYSEKISISPWAIMGLPENSDYQIEIQGDEVSIIGSSLSQYPQGDEEWANQMEANYPLASWIASPSKNRWQRWQRISTRIDPEWLALLDLDYLPIEKISELANQAPESVRRIFSDKITAKLREDPDNLLRSWPAIDPKQANIGAAWLASHFIQNCAWLPEESYSDLIGWAVEAWLSQPPKDSLGALTGLSWLFRALNKPQKDFDIIIKRVKNISSSLPDHHHLNTWSRLYDHALGIRNADLEDIGRFMTNLPNSWWAPFSCDFLITILEEPISIQLLNIGIPWCAVILSPVGEKSKCPGLESISYSGCRSEIIPLLENFFRSIQDDSVDIECLDQLSDLKNAIESVREGRIPQSGKSHNLSGWLAQPPERWPEFTMEMIMRGDLSISERLTIGKSGFHRGLIDFDNPTQPLGS